MVLVLEGGSVVSLTALHAIVYGRVQGVFFRNFVQGRATKLGLTGYVRNLRVGAVEVRAEGEREQLEKLRDYLKVGPPAARVEKVEAEWLEYTGDYHDFDIRY